MANFTLGQCFLNFFQARVGDLGFLQVKRGELLEFGHLLEARVGDFGVENKSSSVTFSKSAWVSSPLGFLSCWRIEFSTMGLAISSWGPTAGGLGLGFPASAFSCFPQPAPRPAIRMMRLRFFMGLSFIPEGRLSGGFGNGMFCLCHRVGGAECPIIPSIAPPMTATVPAPVLASGGGSRYNTRHAQDPLSPARWPVGGFCQRG